MVAMLLPKYLGEVARALWGRGGLSNYSCSCVQYLVAKVF